MPPLPLPLLLLLLLSHSPLLPSSASAWGRRGIVVGVRVAEEGRVGSFFKSNPDRENAARNCLEHLSLSSCRFSAISSGGGGMSVEDHRAFSGAALLYEYDRWSVLRYVNGTRQVASAMAFVLNFTRLTSNALAMIAALQQFRGDDVSLWTPPQVECDGYWPAGSGGGDGGGDTVLSFPADLKADITVCKAPGGGCDYATVQEGRDGGGGEGRGGGGEERGMGEEEEEKEERGREGRHFFKKKLGIYLIILGGKGVKEIFLSEIDLRQQKGPNWLSEPTLNTIKSPELF